MSHMMMSYRVGLVIAKAKWLMTGLEHLRSPHFLAKVLLSQGAS
jgi:hypothetical protein